MSNPMDKAIYTAANTTEQQSFNIASMYKMAMQNPQAFVEQFKRSNPQAYEQAMLLAKTKNPKDIVMQVLSKRGINPAAFMSR